MFHVIENFLDNRDDFELRANIFEEIQLLEKYSSKITPNPHAVYHHILPHFLINNKKSSFFPKLYDDWSILKLYNHTKILNTVKQLTNWQNVYTLPLHTTQGFEINNKINFYNSNNSSRLDWHFDKVYNYKGNQIVCVYTIQNDWDYVDTLNKPFNLEILENNKFKKVYLGNNTLSLHDPNVIFHRVLPFEGGFNMKRTVFVMRYTNDPTPLLGLEKLIGSLRYGYKNIKYMFYVRDLKWCIYLLCFFLLLKILVYNKLWSKIK